MRAKPILPPSYKTNQQRGFCRWCGEPIIDPKTKQINRRRSWHKEKCLEEYLFATDPRYARLRTFERDGGKCRCCGLDIAALIQKHAELRSKLAPGHPGHCPASSVEFDKLRHEMVALGFKENHVLTGENLWQMDHIIPVYKSGGDLDWFKIENTQTLCWPCHKQKTNNDMKHRRTERAMRQLHPESWRQIIEADKERINHPPPHARD